MPPNNNNLTSAWSRQMRSLRRQVDRIDLKMLHLLQKRTKLAGEIGQIKRRRRAVIYVPQRERELLARLARVNKGRVPARVVTAIYREILSGSRAAQGQGPIGLLKGSTEAVLPSARWCFGACDEFLPQGTWPALMRGLGSGALSLALVTGDDLLRGLRSAPARKAFTERFEVVGDLPLVGNGKGSLSHHVFIITPRGEGTVGKASRILILIECNSTANAIKTLLSPMLNFSLAAEYPARSLGRRTALALLGAPKPVEAPRVSDRLLGAAQSAGLPLSILGIYSGTENYGG